MNPDLQRMVRLYKELKAELTSVKDQNKKLTKQNENLFQTLKVARIVISNPDHYLRPTLIFEVDCILNEQKKDEAA